MTKLYPLSKAPLTLGLAAAAIALPFATPALAGGAAEDIVVESVSAIEQWQAKTTKQLNRALDHAPLASRSDPPNNSVVEVAFVLGDDGKAKDIKVMRGDGNYSARHIAKYAVKRLEGLDSVPVVTPQGTRFLAQIIFANNRDTYDELKADLAKSNASRLALAGEEGAPILLGG